MFSALFSVLFFIFLGFLARHFKVIEPKQAPILMDFVIYFSIPALVFDKIYHLEFSPSLLYLVAFGMFGTLVGALAVLALGRVLSFSRATLVTMVMMASFGNTGFIGFPVVQGFFGEEALELAILYDQFATSIPIAILGPLILSAGGAERVSFRQTLLKILRFPPLVALVLAFLLKGVPLPALLFEPLRMLSATVVPLALVGIGAQLRLDSIRTEWRASAVILAGKMMIAPLAMLGAILLFGVELGREAMVMVVQASMPPMVLASAMVMKAQLNTPLALASVALGVGVSLVSLPAIYGFLAIL